MGTYQEICERLVENKFEVYQTGEVQGFKISDLILHKYFKKYYIILALCKSSREFEYIIAINPLNFKYECISIYELRAYCEVAGR